MRCLRLQEAFTHDLLFLLVLCLCFSGVRGTRKCYYPDGASAESDRDCNTEGENSTCCGEGYVCLGNGVCWVDPATPGVDEKLARTLWRGSCTDYGWNASICPQFCTKTTGPQSGNLGSAQQLGKCPGTENTYYCKPPTGDVDCSDPSKVSKIKTIPKNSIPAVLQPTETSTSRTIATTQSVTPITYIITSTQSPPPTWPWPAPTETNIPKNDTAAQATATPDIETGSYASRHAVAIGVGVGGSVGLAIIILLTVFIYYRRQRRSMELEEVYKGPLPPVRPRRPDVDSPFDHRVVGMLPRDRVVGRHRIHPPLEPLYLPPIQSPLPLSPVFEHVGRAL